MMHQRWFAALCLFATLIGGCATTPTALEQSSRPITGYLDYSYDKNSVIFNTRDSHPRTVFFDTYYPFDPSLRYNNAEAMVRYELDHAPFVHNGVLMVARLDGPTVAIARGLVDKALVLCLPGKPSGAVECLGFVVGAIPHCVEVLKEVPTSC